MKTTGCDIERAVKADAKTSAHVGMRMAAECKVDVLANFAETRGAHASLSWGVRTARISLEDVAKLVAMKPKAYVAAAKTIAGDYGMVGQRELYDRWLVAIRTT